MCDKRKLDEMANDAIKELQEELHPEKRGITITLPEVHLVTIAKYEGMALVLQRLGADITALEEAIEASLHEVIYKK